MEVGDRIVHNIHMYAARDQSVAGSQEADRPTLPPTTATDYTCTCIPSRLV